jgi:hypothetical protein
MAVLMELGAATYDLDTWIATVESDKVVQLLATGELSMPDHALLYFAQLPSMKFRVILIDEGLRIVMNIDGEDTMIEGPIPEANIPSMEEFLG